MTAVLCPVCGSNLHFELDQSSSSEYAIAQIYVNPEDPTDKYLHMYWDQIDVAYGPVTAARVFCSSCAYIEENVTYGDQGPPRGWGAWQPDESFDD